MGAGGPHRAEAMPGLSLAIRGSESLVQRPRAGSAQLEDSKTKIGGVYLCGSNLKNDIVWINVVDRFRAVGSECGVKDEFGH